ncbi:MAG: hypothetical protein KC587_13645, partial [Nitrospira sp.]|nr:hypothetical protein [Nitrospira sp.]
MGTHLFTATQRIRLEFWGLSVAPLQGAPDWGGFFLGLRLLAALAPLTLAIHVSTFQAEKLVWIRGQQSSNPAGRSALNPSQRSCVCFGAHSWLNRLKSLSGAAISWGDLAVQILDEWHAQGVGSFHQFLVETGKTLGRST